MGKFQNPNAKKPMGRAKESVSQPPNALCNRARPIIASLRRLSCLPKPPFTCRQSEVRVKHNATFRTRRTPQVPQVPQGPTSQRVPESPKLAHCRLPLQPVPQLRAAALCRAEWPFRFSTFRSKPDPKRKENREQRQTRASADFRGAPTRQPFAAS